MSSLSALMDLSRSALLADQAALNVTSNNVANQNTVGYTNEVVNWTPGDTVTLSGGRQTSQGPTVSTTSLRDRVLEQRVQQQTQQQSATAAEAGILSQVEGVFSITGSSATAGSTQLGTAINAMFSSLSALAANPSDPATQTAALSAATAMANAFNTAAAGLASIQASIGSSVQTSTVAVNALTTTIAKLNEQIGSTDPGKDGGQLEDQRQNAIAQLSQYIGLNQITTEGNGLTLTTSGGTVLVAGIQSYALSASQVGTGAVLHDAAGTDITAATTGGSLGGQLAAQTADLPQIASALDALAYRVGGQLSAANQNGLRTSGAPGSVLFNLPPTAAGAAAAISVSNPATNAIATAGLGEGPTGNTNALALAGLAHAVDASGETIAGNLAALLGSIGSTSSGLAAQTATQQASLTQLTTLRDTLSGVNLDSEAANLTTYQRAYQAAAQVMTVIDKLLAAAINLGGTTTAT